MAAKLIGERLPQHWSYGVTRDGRIFFIDDRVQATTWLHPVTGQSVQTGFQGSPGLPPGWEQALTPEGAIYFIDHNNHCTTFEHPVTGKPVNVDLPPPNRTPPQSPTQLKPRKGSTKSKGIKAPTAARTENSKVIMRGWLQKQESSGLKLWKKKWCVLADYALFFYKDDSEQNEQGSLLLPSYKVSPCLPSEGHKRFTFKAEHENLKTQYFLADNQVHLEKWVGAMQMVSMVQRLPGSGSEPQKLIPKSPIMSWNDSDTSPLSPPDMQQYPFSGPKGADTSRTSSQFGDDFRDRSPLQSRENTQNYRNQNQQGPPYDGYGRLPNEQHPGYNQGQGHPSERQRDPRTDYGRQGDERGSQRGSRAGSQRGSHAYNPSGDYGALSYDSQSGEPHGQNRSHGNISSSSLPQRPYAQEDSRIPGYDRQPSNHGNANLDVSRGSSDQRYPVDNYRSRSKDDPRSPLDHRQSSNTLPVRHSREGPVPSSRGQFSHSSLPRGSKPDYHDDRDGLARHPDNLQRSSQRDPRSRQQGDTSFNSLPRDSRYPDEADFQPPRQGQGQRYPGESPQGREPPASHSSPRQGYDTKPQRSPENAYMVMTPPQQKQYNQRPLQASKNNNRPLPKQPPPEPIHERSRSGGGDYASLQRIRDHIHGRGEGQHDVSRSSASQDPHSPSSQHSSATSPQRQKPDLYVDIPHTYVNVYNESQPRDVPPELPSRPPLPTSVRQQIVEDIALTATPHTQNDLLTAERNLELRMQQPSYFDYPTPRRENAPPTPQGQYPDPSESPRSQQSRGRDDRRDDPRSRQDRGARTRGPPQDARRDVGRQPSSVAMDTELIRQAARNSFSPEDRVDYRQDNYNPNESRDSLGGYSGRYNTGERAATLGRYPQKDMYSDRNQRFMSDLDVRTRTLPNKPVAGVTGEKDFRLRSLPDHAQSMPSIFHEPPLSVQVGNHESQPSVGSYINLGPPSVSSDSRLLVGDANEDPTVRKSAFRPLSRRGDNSVQETPSRDNSLLAGDGRLGSPQSSTSYPAYNQPYPGSMGVTDPQRMSSASSPMTQHPPAWPTDGGYPGQSRSDEGRQRGQGRNKGQRAPPIDTVKEDPNMPDSDIVATELPRKIFPLNGPRLRMSISAGELLGKTHDELVLLLIQLRRDKSELQGQRDNIRKAIDKRRPAELQYRKRQNAGLGAVDPESELEHRRYIDMKHQCEEVEKKLEVYKPLVNLVSNMVTMGSLYGGDNLMLATEYRKHLLSPDQYSPPKKMVEFSRRQQEDRIVKEIENDVKQLTQEEADLEDKLDRLYELDRMLQEQSFQVTSLKEDRELLDKALGGILKQQDQALHPRDKEKLLQQQRTIEKELSRVLQQLAQASRELEETSAENNRVEHEVALLRSKVHGDLSRSKSAPSLSSESMRTKMKMEKDLAKVQTMMEGLSKEGARLSEVMNTLRRSSSGGGLMKGLPPQETSTDVKEPKPSSGTYYETDLDTSKTKDLSQVTALLASYQLAPGQMTEQLHMSDPSLEPVAFQPLTSEMASKYRSQPPRGNPDSSAFHSPGDPGKDWTYHASPAQVLFGESPKGTPGTGEQSPYNMNGHDNMETDEGDRWDIGEADDNTKRFYGLIPKNMPKSQTVRDVKRNSEQRRETKKKEDEPPLRISVIPSEYSDPNFPVYENLPQQKSTTAAPSSSTSQPWSTVLPENDTPTGSQRRRSSLHLMVPKPFIPYSAQSSVVTAPSYSHSSFSSVPSLSSTSASQSFSQPPDTMTTTFKSPEQPLHDSMTTYGSADPTDSSTVLAKPWGDTDYKKTTPTRKSPRGRYLTISSSQPIKMEKNILQSPKMKSPAGDLISSMEIPDIVKSSTTQIDQFDERTIDREILFFPNKVLIPERYNPESDDEDLTEEEKAERTERAEKIKRILTQQSVHSMSQPDVSQVAGEVHERVQQEKLKREQLLAIGHELAEQVKKKSRQFAAERRKTWSGTPSRTDASTSDKENNEDTAYMTNGNHYPDNSGGDPYITDMGDNSNMTNSYMSNGDPYMYQDTSSYKEATSYQPRQNFRI